jgi:hypothetical protein
MSLRMWYVVFWSLHAAYLMIVAIFFYLCVFDISMRSYILTYSNLVHYESFFVRYEMLAAY